MVIPIEPVAPPLRGRSLSAQRWQNLAFLHWPIAPDAVADMFPAGARPDVIDGLTYVGLVPFVMRAAGPGGRVPVPYFGDFCETNVRLYSVDDADRHGVVFLTLDASRLATVLLARWGLGLPYGWSKMSAASRGDRRRYELRRRWPTVPGPAVPRTPVYRTSVYRAAVPSGRPYCHVSLRVGQVVEPTPLEVWLTARWGLHTRVAGRTIWVPNEHPAWPLHAAELIDLDSDLVASCGVTVDPASMLRPLWSPGVRTTFGLPQRV